MSPKAIRLGILVPSSNTALEPLTTALLASINASLPNTPDITAHFSRFPVTTISLSPTGLAQFDLAPILFAASLLAHANVDIIGWSGTAAGWLGFEKDVELCAEIEKETGIKATTSVLALNKVLELWSVERLGLVTPYVDDVQAKIVQNYGKIGVQIVGEKHLRVEKNNAIADIGEEVLDGMVQEVIVFDTVTTVVWDMLRERGVDMSGVEGWGMIFKKV
ncbi:hypothetical protein LOCC1_G003612 [Lachnellula occidentalis]|uniref:Asp/Glu/hydantoin racemase n=1 Tax=Lachnellula occidentalis TaxID=215460 RepID=A0A8H8UIC3_9HELO|nr:hypothetical protein LOCC1_G003612 [Lachnellula occidentalis]